MADESNDVYRWRTSRRVGRRLRRGDTVRRKNPRKGQQIYGQIIKIRPVGPKRVTVKWKDGSESAVAYRSLELL